MKSIRAFDKYTAKQILRLPTNLHHPFEMLGYATTPFIWGVILVIYNVIAYNGQLAASVLVLLLLPLATISKLAFRRQRPPTIYAGNMRIKSYSFPSSHAYTAALGGGFFAMLCFTSNSYLLGSLVSAIVIIVGVSRVYLGAHYPSDVLAGWALGLVMLYVTTLI